MPWRRSSAKPRRRWPPRHTPSSSAGYLVRAPARETHLPTSVGSSGRLLYPPARLWRWELEAIGESRTKVTHTYDWSQLTDAKRLARARATTDAKLEASL